MPLFLDLPIAALVDVLISLTMVLFVLSAFLLSIVVLLQEGKGGGLTGAFGGAGADAFGVKSGTVNKFTAWLGAAFLGLALLHAGLVSASGVVSIEDPDKPDIGGLVNPGDDEKKPDDGSAPAPANGDTKPGDGDDKPGDGDTKPGDGDDKPGDGSGDDGDK